MCPQRVETVGGAGLVAKLDLKCVVGKHLDYCTNLPRNEAQLGQVADERHGIKQMDVGISRHIEVSNG